MSLPSKKPMQRRKHQLLMPALQKQMQRPRPLRKLRLQAWKSHLLHKPLWSPRKNGHGMRSMLQLTAKKSQRQHRSLANPQADVGGRR